MREIKNNIRNISKKYRESGRPIKIFFSLGMNGRSDEEIRDLIEEATKSCECLFGSVAILDGFFTENAPDSVENKGVYWMGRSLELLSQADLVIFLNDWYEYRGCKMEEKICCEYEVPHISLDLRCLSEDFSITTGLPFR